MRIQTCAENARGIYKLRIYEDSMLINLPLLIKRIDNSLHFSVLSQTKDSIEYA